MSHTPGPWRVGEPSDGTFSVWVMSGHRQLVADVIRAADAPSFQFCTGPADEAESEANARLIAAAPDLLDAVRNLLAASSPASRRLARTWAEAAMTKAIGEDES